MKFYLACMMLLIVSQFGCSPSESPQRVAVKGTVLMDGNPIDDVLIQFVPTGDASGTTVLVAAGQFHADEQQGPTPGEFSIVLSPNAPEAEQAFELMQSGERDPLKLETVPAIYRRPGELSATVIGDGPHEFTFDLRSY